MELFSRSKITDVPEAELPPPAHGIKKPRLNKPLSWETISAAAAETLRAGGWVGPSTTPASVVDPPEPKIGEKMPDGTVYAGISPDTNKPMYATPADADLTPTFNEAIRIVDALNFANGFGHNDWRVPTKNELNVLFNNRAAIGGFNVSGSNPSGWYWSSSSFDKWDAWGQRFSDGYQSNVDKNGHSSVRCVSASRIS